MTENKIHVCSACFRRTCFMGIFYCEDSKTAGIVKKSKADLDRLNREHPSNYEMAFTYGDSAA